MKNIVLKVMKLKVIHVYHWHRLLVKKIEGIVLITEKHFFLKFVLFLSNNKLNIYKS